MRELACMLPACFALMHLQRLSFNEFLFSPNSTVWYDMVCSACFNQNGESVSIIPISPCMCDNWHLYTLARGFNLHPITPQAS